MEQITRIFKGRGFWKSVLPNKSDKEYARDRFREYVRSLSECEIILESENVASAIDVLLTDEDRNVRHVYPLWDVLGIDGGPRIVDRTMSHDAVKQINVVMVPGELNNAMGEYAVGGLLVGGITGAVLG